MLMDLITDVAHRDEAVFAEIRSRSAPVVLFGAGEVAWYTVTYLRQHHIEPLCICDNDHLKHGTSLLGVPICSYDQLSANKPMHSGRYDIVLSAGPMHHQSILNQLQKAGEQNPIRCILGYEMCGDKITRQFVREHHDDFEAAYSLFGETRSKDVFVSVLNAKLSGDFALYARIQSAREYFDRDVFCLADDEVLLDIGAYTGTVTAQFHELTQSRNRGIIAMEPNEHTFVVLQASLETRGIRGVELHNKGAWNKKAVLTFETDRQASSRVVESDGTGTARSSIDVDTIDNVLNGRRVTYITMDIEGAEHNAILGAAQTIRTWKPRLAVCVYHRREDLYDLPLLIHSLAPDYRFYLRHYSSDQTETVLYAI